MSEIQFDDLPGLQKAVSEEFSDFGPKLRITQEMIQSFADLTRDQQWIHVDAERCRRESPYGAPIAHGFFTLSLIPFLRPPGRLTVTGYKNAINYGAESLRFLSPVVAGAEIHARIRLVAAEAKPKGTLVTLETAVHTVGNDKPALLYRGLVLYQG